MTVKELIEALSQHNQESEVHVAIVEFGEQKAGRWTNPVEGVSLGKHGTVLLHRPTHGSSIEMEKEKIGT